MDKPLKKLTNPKSTKKTMPSSKDQKQRSGQELREIDK
jgi:hypothetical protein